MSAYPYEVHETEAHGTEVVLDAIVTTPGGEVVAGMATRGLGSWTFTLFDGHGGDASGFALDTADARNLLQFHAALLSRTLTAEAVAS